MTSPLATDHEYSSSSAQSLPKISGKIDICTPHRTPGVRPLEKSAEYRYMVTKSSILESTFAFPLNTGHFTTNSV